MNIEWISEKDYKTVMNIAKKDRVTARRMLSIEAAKNFNDLVPGANGRAKFLKREYEGYFSIDLKRKTNPERLICEPIGEFKKNENGQYIKDTITEFLVVKIDKDYHKK